MTNKRDGFSKTKRRKAELIPIGKILPPTAPERSKMTNKGLEELKASIIEIGLLHPIGVKKEGDSYRISYGHRRFVVAVMLGWPALPAVVMDWSDGSDDAMFTENYHREEVNPLDEAVHLQKYVNKHNNITQKECAERLGISPAYLSSRLKILRWPPVLQDAVKEQKITFSVGRELVQITDLNYMSEMLYYAIEGGCTPDQAKAWRMQWENAVAAEMAPKIPYEESSSFVAPVQLYPCHCCRENFTEPSALKAMFVCQVCERVIKESMAEVPEQRSNPK